MISRALGKNKQITIICMEREKNEKTSGEIVKLTLKKKHHRRREVFQCVRALL